MNMDFALVNRALLNIGMAPVGGEDRAADNAAWRTAREYYLETPREALAQVEWTGAKRRRELSPARMPHKKNPDFAYAYMLPADCAKPVELDGRGYFETEARILYTDAAPARLLYVSDGRRTVDRIVIRGGDARRRPGPDYFSGGDADRKRRYEHGDNFVTGGNADRPPVIAPPPEAFEDFPDYREPDLEPNFYLYWETMLPAKYALRLTDKPDLAMVYFNKAQAIGRAAETVSAERSAARRTAPVSWQEELGLA
jgi:hypothetical protein